MVSYLIRKNYCIYWEGTVLYLNVKEDGEIYFEHLLTFS